MSVDGDGAGSPVRPNFCSRCGDQLAPGANFCSRCGQPVIPVQAAPYQAYPTTRNMTIRDLVMGMGTYASIALVALLAINVVIALWGIGLVYPQEGSISLFVIVPFIVPLVTLSGGAFFLYYVLLAAAIAASFAWLAWKSTGSIGDEMVLRAPAKGHSPLYLVGTVFMAVLAFNIVYYLIIQGAGTSPNTPSFGSAELWQIIYGYAEASVWEEIVSRVLLIGIPLLIIDGLIRSSDPEFRMKRVHRYILGGGFEIGKKEAFFLAFSSLMFGAAHVFAWDLYKVLPAAVAGLAFGYLYLKVGLYASIMLHFAFDFLSVPLDVFPGSDLLSVVLGLAIIAWVLVGIPYLVLYFSKMVGWMAGRKVWPDRPLARPKQAYSPYGYYQYPAMNGTAAYPPPAPGAPPAPYPGTPASGQAAQYPGRPRDPTAFGFTCRNCGHREAVYKDGELICTRCGTKN